MYKAILDLNCQGKGQENGSMAVKATMGTQSKRRHEDDKKDAESGDGDKNDKADGEEYAELDQNALNSGPRWVHF